MTTLHLQDIHHRFQQGDLNLHVLKGINLKINRGECVALLGPSGSGKSTLLQIAGLLEYPSSGEVMISAKKTTKLPDTERTNLRNTYIGFVYQFHHLLPEFSALENVIIPQLIAKKSERIARKKAISLLERFGLGHRIHHQPKKMSGGEQQRVAIARALANDPAILIADEPTGNLDHQTSSQVFQELIDLVRQEKLSTFIATHNNDLADKMDRIVKMQDGQLVEV